MLGETLEKAMGMNDARWRRHANPWSGWTRVPVLPLFALAVWSRAWIGWYALGPVAAVLFWIWINPRIFPEPKKFDNWMTKGVLGERLWLNRKNVSIPRRHARMAILLSVVSLIGLAPYGWGLWRLDLWMTIAGILFTLGGKMWFIDRMVWLFEDMKD